MSWNVVQSAKTTATATYTTTGACTFTSNLTSGTKIIAAVAVSIGASATTVSGVADGHGNSLTLCGRGTVTGLVDVSLWAMDTPAADAGTKPVITATLGTSNGQFSITLLEVSGLAAGSTTAAMLDGTLGAKTGTAGSSTGSPAYVSTASSEFLVSVYGDDGGPETFTKPSALTLAASNVNSSTYADCAIAYGNSTNGTEAGSWALTGSSAQWVTLLVAFNLAAAGTVINAADTGAGTDAATVQEGGSGFDAGTGTDAASVVAQSTAAPVFAASYSPAGSTSLAVSATQSGTGVFAGMALTVKVITGASGSPIGATATSDAVTTPELAITPSGTGSWVYGVLVNDSAAAVFGTPANATFSQNEYWSGDEICFGTFRSSGTTTATDPVTLGATGPAETAGNLQIALLEILASGTLAEDSSSPAAVYTTTATTIATAPFAPPPSSLLVAMVASDCTGTSGQAMTMELSDSSGLTWTRQETANYVNGTGTFQSATVWTAVAGSSSGSDWTTAASPKTQSVSASPGNVIVMLGGTQTAATTLAAPTGGPASWTAGGASAVTGYCAGYGWAMAVPGLSQGGGTGTGGGGTVTGGGTASAVAVTTVSLPTAQVSQAYSVTLAATGGTGTPYTWTVTSGSLPAGLSLAAATGVISGTPSGSAATDDITVTATDPGGNSASAPLVMTVITGPSSGPSGSWKLAFADEFDVAYPTPYGTGPNPNVWSDRLLNGDMGRNEGSPDQEWFPHGYYGHSVANSVWTGTIAYQNPGTIDPTITSALSVDAGNATTGLEFTAANISSFPGYSHTYGYVEARIQQPAPGSVHCAWWMLTRGGTWPPEIDIAEWQNSASNTGKDDNAYYNMASTWQTTYYSGDSSSYHVYGCEVTATTVTFYRDGTVTSTQSYDGNARPWFMMVGAGVNGASGGSGYPAAYNVDYIRAWVPSGVPAAPVITAISPATGIPSGGDVAVTFGTVSGATSYRVTASPTDSIQDNIDNYGNGGDGIPGPYTATGSSSPLTVTGIPAGRWNFTVAAINSTGYSPESAPAGPQIINIQMVTAVLPGATAGAAYSATLAAQAGVTPYTWAISSGTLPAGLTLGASTGVISGTPAAAGESEFTVKVSGNTGWSGGTTVANSATAALSITTGTGTGGGTGPGTTTLSITTTSLPAATVGTTYSEALTATGGTGTGYTWTVTAGTLPSWASLNASTGVISGDPAAAGTSSFTVKVTDSGSNTATQALSVTANAAATTAPVGPSGSWTLVFEDDFTGTSLNTSNWTALQGANINGLTTQASAVSVSGGYLRVAYGGAVNSNPANDDYGSGSDGPVLAVGDCCEAMINFPGPSGDTAYNWPAWWVAGGSWPANGEEDIWESYNGTPSALNYHSHTGANNGPFPAGTWCNSFHTYTLVRGATELQVWWDGVLVRTVTPNDSGGTQSLLINCGAGNTASKSAVILVEYVRMWTPG